MEQTYHIIEDVQEIYFVKAELLKNWKLYEYILYSLDYYEIETNQVYYISALKVSI